jgi:hypothetical protein
MKTRNLFPAVLALFSAFSLPPSAFGQGSLTPPGPPGPAMLTLSQVEPRTPVSSLPYTITQPGSYYATTNLTEAGGTNGVTIACGSVTLDLRGFTLSGGAGSLTGILIDGALTNVTVENGTVSGWGGNGINADSLNGGTFNTLNLVNNGNDGLDPGQNCWMRSCLASGNAGNGFGAITNDDECNYQDCIADNNRAGGFFTDSQCAFANCRADNNSDDGFFPFFQCVFKNCSSDYNGGDGINCPYSGCVLEQCEANNDSIGIWVDHSTLRDCATTYNDGDGIDAGSGSTLANCAASFNGGDGINVTNDCVLADCIAETNSQDNIVTSVGCTLDHCSAGFSDTGNGFTLGSGNTITACNALGNAVNGIDAVDRTTVRSCTATFNGNAGIRVEYQGTVQNCTSGNNGTYGILSDANGYASILDNDCSFNGVLTYGGTPSQGAGIYITNSPGCRIEGNTLDINYAALVVAPTNNAFILRNSADANVATNYVFGAGNSWGPIVDVTAGGDISTISTSSHPDANFIH